MKIPLGFSRSTDKVREHLMKTATADVKQFLLKDNPLKLIKESSLKLKLKAVEEDEEKANKVEFKPPYLES